MKFEFDIHFTVCLLSCSLQKNTVPNIIQNIIKQCKFCRYIFWLILRMIKGCMDSVLMTNEMHNSYNQFFYSTVFCLLYLFRKNLVVYHQEHGIIYCITRHNLVQSCCKHNCTDCTKLCNTVYYAVLLTMND